MQKITLKISGMHCNSCAKLVRGALEEEKGVSAAEVDFDSAQAIVKFDAKKIDFTKINEIIKDLGYKAEKIS